MSPVSCTLLTRVPAWRRGREYLRGGEEEVFPEGQTEHVEVLAAVAEGGQHVREHLALLDVVRVDQHNAICRECKHTSANIVYTSKIKT